MFTVAEVHELLAATRPDSPCVVVGDTVVTWAEMTERSRRFATALRAAGLGNHRDRAELQNWESGQDHLALFLHSSSEYLEAMLGCFKARVAPCNVNSRYVADELVGLLEDSEATGLVFHSSVASVVAEALRERTTTPMLIQVDDCPGIELLPGARWYHDVLAAHEPLVDGSDADPDDLYLLYTGGTTGRPKAVMWRQGEALTECFGFPRSIRSLDEMDLAGRSSRRALVVAPLAHGAGQWITFSTWNTGGTVFLLDPPHPLDPARVWSAIERHGVDFLLIVGDALARPLVDELRRTSYDLSSLTVILSGGAALSSESKRELLALLPGVMILDGVGSSESGGLATSLSTGSEPTTRFPPGPGTVVLSADLDRVLQPGEPELGWLAKRGRLALGYLADPDATRRIHPIVDGVRYVVPGDRAMIGADGTIDLRGRDSVTINSGGEKIFAEEVERAVASHPAVYDCVVAGRPSVRWGEEVVAVVSFRAGASADREELRNAAAQSIARYKLPKAFVVVERVRRTESGKADYRWTRRIVRGEIEEDRTWRDDRGIRTPCRPARRRLVPSRRCSTPSLLDTTS
ncbi:MAG: AMP-binding protein [Ilumatobacteraceae bacterium]